MASLLRVSSSSQSSLLFLSPDLHPISRVTTTVISFNNNNSSSSRRSSSSSLIIVPKSSSSSHRLDTILKVASTDKTNNQQQVVVELDNTGGGGGGGGDGFGSGGGGGGGGDNNNNNNEGEEEEGDLNNNHNMAMSMSQKLTLAYAALIGVGGVMGYIKSGSQKSLAAGGISASLLYFVYTQLPTNPVLASSLGLGLSAALLVVMGSRFKKSGKVFPAGVVSIVSFVMTGGYLHGIMRSVMHG